MALINSSSTTSAARGPMPGVGVLWVGGPSLNREEVESVMAGLGVPVRWTTGTTQAVAIQREHPDLVCLVDLTRGGESLRIARTLRSENPRALVVGVVDSARPDSTLDAFRLGVFDVLPWPLAPWDLHAVLSNARDLQGFADEHLEDRVPLTPYGVFGPSPAMRKIVELFPRIAPSRCAVLLYGERGTGREMLARAIHGHGRQPGSPFVMVDCSSVTPQDLEHDLFGYVSQRRSDGQDERRSVERLARRSKLFEASGGTLFLQNVGELPTRLQARLHRLLRDREVVMASERERIELDIRPMTAAEPGFESLVEEGRLRRDLYDRLSLVRIELPPLRHRREDIPFLANHFLKEICRAGGVPIKTLTRSALTLLSALPWRGNAPELRALLERLVLLTPHGSIRLEDLLAQVRLDSSEIGQAGGASLREARLRFERDYIAAVVRQHHGRMGDAAHALGIQRTNLYRKLRQLSVIRPSKASRRGGVSPAGQRSAADTDSQAGRLTRKRA